MGTVSELRLPADREHILVAKRAAGAFGSLAGFDMDAIDDLTIAVAQACENAIRCLEHSGSIAGQVKIVFKMSDTGLEVTVRSTVNREAELRARAEQAGLGPRRRACRRHGPGPSAHGPLCRRQHVSGRRANRESTRSADQIQGVVTPAPGHGDGVATRERTIAKPAETAERAEMRRLLREFNKTRDPRIREQLVELNSDLVHYIARRFANRGEPLEDIEQVGFLGLIQAIERFDPSLENEFSTFATPTIAGEIRRHFRDRSWAVRVPRRLQENLAKVNAATQQLQNELGRSPSVAEIGARVGLDPDQVLAAMEVAPAQHTISLDGPVGGGDEPVTLGDRLGLSDDNLERVEMQDVLEQVMAHLTPRERKILALRFVEQLPQTEVAKRLGISQMHVSRLQRAAVEHLRKEFGAEAPV